MKRFVLTGTSGLLGQAWLTWLESQEGAEVISVGRTPPPGSPPPNAMHATLDLTRPSHAVDRMVALKPYAIIHMAWSDDAEALTAMATTVAESARMCRAKAVFLSCDRVFDGASGPFDEEATPLPASAMGKGLRAAEEILERTCDDRLLLRTSALFGWCPNRLQALVSRWWARWQQGGVVVAPVDVMASPAWVDALPKVGQFLLRRDGVFHLRGSERISLYELACRLAATLDVRADRVKGMAAGEDPAAYGPAFGGGLVSDRYRAFTGAMPSLEQATGNWGGPFEQGPVGAPGNPGPQ